MIGRALNRVANSRPAGSPPLCATIEISALCESCRSGRRGGGCPRASSRTANSISSTSRTTAVDDAAGPDQASAHGRLVLFCGLHRRDSHRGSPAPLRVGCGADRVGPGRVRFPGGESWSLSVDGPGSTTHRAARGELRHLPAAVAGSIQQTDLWDAVRRGWTVRTGALVDVLTTTTLEDYCGLRRCL